MANTTIWIGAMLVVLGVGGYLLTGGASATALIPAVFGAVLVGLGLLARHEAWRKHAMHAAAAVGLLGFLGSVGGLIELPALLAGGDVARPAAVISRALMALLTGFFFALTLKSFIDARRRRANEA